MQYLHDVWVNWFEGEENGYNVCDFHEWRKQDGIEILDQVPVIYVSKPLFDLIENDLADLPKKMLDYIKNRAYLRKNQDRIPLEYASIITNGRAVLVFDTMGYSVPIRKSRLIPRQERLVYEMIKNSSVEHFANDKKIEEKAYHILSLPPEEMLGLTRRERQLKQVLMMALDQIERTNNKEQLQYWLTEWAPQRYETIRKMSMATAWQTLYEELVYGWSISHEIFCKKIIKGQPFFEKIWELEDSEPKNQSYKRIL